jgi:hypothetical protein
MASTKIKYLGTTLIKEVTNLYNENYKSPKKEINDDIIRQKTSHTHGLAESIL